MAFDSSHMIYVVYTDLPVCWGGGSRGTENCFYSWVENKTGNFDECILSKDTDQL